MDRDVIINVLNRMTTCPGDPLIVKPAGGMELRRLQEDLNKLKEQGLEIPLAPTDYLEFLEIANGVSWNGFEFFGTYQVTEKKSGYTLPDIVTMNDKIYERKLGIAGRLLLGRFDDDIYVYNDEDASFQVLDSLTLTEIESYESFELLFAESLLPYMFYESLPSDDDDEEYPPDDEDYPIDDET